MLQHLIYRIFLQRHETALIFYSGDPLGSQLMNGQTISKIAQMARWKIPGLQAQPTEQEMMNRRHGQIGHMESWKRRMCGIARRGELASCTDPTPPFPVALHIGEHLQIFLRHRICKMNETVKCFIDMSRQEVKDETRRKLRDLGEEGHCSQAPSI